MAKVRIQAGTDENEDDKLPEPAASSQKKDKRNSAVALLARVLKEQGIIGWYRVSWISIFKFFLLSPELFSYVSSLQGMGAQITKAVLSQALLFMSKDQFEQYALLIMIMQRKLRST